MALRPHLRALFSRLAGRARRDTGWAHAMLRSMSVCHELAMTDVRDSVSSSLLCAAGIEWTRRLAVH